MQQYSTLHAAARAYAEAGIPVFPCEVDSKPPVTKNGFKDATTNLEQIDLWWGEADYNVAFCPDDAGLFVVDIDPGAELTRDKFPATYTVKTPRGGFHLFFEGSGKSTANKLAPHVDTRGVGGYVLAPPSTVGGKPYVAEAGMDYAPLPEWISKALAVADAPLKSAVEKLDLGVNIDRARKVLHNYVKRGEVAKEGLGGNHRTYQLFCELHDIGLSPENL